MDLHRWKRLHPAEIDEGAVTGDERDSGPPFAHRRCPPRDQGVPRARSRRYGRADLVFTDFVMAGMSGFELAAALAEAAPGLPVILTTGYRDEILKCGAGGLPVVSPIGSRRLSMRWRRCWRVPRAERARGQRARPGACRARAAGHKDPVARLELAGLCRYLRRSPGVTR
ncbi:response regulator [Sphingomonas parva]|uniref:Response regulator n=1 Tax=Sphingomonas parva TaxID=2555898 RepID=A0A4Y8ZST7_9SPHN|nr:response regulator [Sphingomonas parva]